MTRALVYAWGIPPKGRPGSGTTSVVARKLGRRYIGIEQEETYRLLAKKLLELAEQEPSIQVYSDGYFWERNMLAHQKICGA